MHPFRPLLMPAVVAALIQALVTCSGCASLGKPDWLDPGPVRSQQRKAVRFDPFLEGGPLTSSPGVALLDGTRPRDFSAPVPEIRRSRWWAPAQ